MKRRLLVLAIATATLTGGTSAASAFVGSAANGYWGCVGVRQIDTAVCLENPLPERLVPETPNRQLPS